ncbi:alpha/beta hydrolase family protein [Embleya scabrispora]|uniref:alpha/beta hydrolase family protein n=1 Tax=Embleya scabrispora TaxID=159449 RepID=UPI000371CCAD|nr:alpha/beta fold hydrolase [Embleya scabrispora]MYS78820.1 alpha/beta fold hydrolase [Streptomyces sp. SID5474]
MTSPSPAVTTVFEPPAFVPQFVAGNRSRAIVCGLDPHEYDRVTVGLDTLHDWLPAFRRVGETYRAAGERYAAGGHGVSAGDAFRTAARWLHCATFPPLADHARTVAVAREADAAMGRAFGYLDPGAVRIEGQGFAGWLRRPVGTARPDRVVVVVPGLNSGKEEFHAVDEALLRRGVATFSFDGPGQGVLVDTAPRADYHHVVGRVIDALATRDDVDTTAGVGLVGMSLGGFYAILTAAHEPRVVATVAVSGPYRLDWAELPLFVRETLTVRTGSAGAAEEFARGVDLADIASGIGTPLRVVEGGDDITPGVLAAERAGHEAPLGEVLVRAHGDHLLCNAQSGWLPDTADWLTDRLG